MKQYSVTQVAALLGITRQAVLYRIKAKRLKAEKVGNAWVVCDKVVKSGK